MSTHDRHLYGFGPFSLSVSERLLLREGVRVPLTEKAFDTLLALVRRQGRLAAKEELMAEVWPGAFVEENNLDKSISAIRQALGEKTSSPRYVETVRGRGYRFISPVTETPPEDAVLPHSSGRQPEQSNPTDTGGAPQLPDARYPGVRAGLPVIGATLLVVGLSIGTYLWMEPDPRRGETAAPKTIAVLPFKPIVSGDRDESLEMGIADTLITKLSALRVITVRPIGAVRKFTSLEQDPIAAGRDLRVEAVLDGSIQRSGNRLRATCRLTRVADGVSLWTGTFDSNLADTFAVQDSISEQVTRGLAIQLNNEQRQQLAKHHTDSLEAYQRYLKGRYFWNQRTRDGIEKSLEYFRQAIAADPRYALAYSGLADSYALLSDYGAASPKESLLQAKRAALRALELDDTLAEAHTSVGFVAEVFEWDWSRAEAEYRRALKLNPNYATARHRYGMFLCWMGRFPEAFAELSLAGRLDSTSLIINADNGLALFLARRYEEAAAQLRKTLELGPDFYRAHVYLADCYVQQHKFNDAIAEAEWASKKSTPDRADIVRSYTYSAAGREDEARKYLDSPVLTSRTSSAQPLFLAATYVRMGKRQQALHLLDEAVEQRAIGVLRLGVDPKLDELRPDPGFQHLLERVGLKFSAIQRK